jgi:molybdopterin-guanine dinucleotide biosynthesis protein A
MTERAIFLLCGGRSRRLGRDKRLLDVGGKPLLDAVVAQLAALRLPIFLGLDSTDDRTGSPPGIGRWWDGAAGRGPLPNLLAALRRWGDEILLCPADRLLPDVAALAALLAHAEQAPEADVVVFEIDGRLEPLHGLYRQRVLAPLSEAWGAGRESLREFLTGLPAGACARLPVDALGIDLNSRPEIASLRQLAKEIVWPSEATN